MELGWILWDLLAVVILLYCVHRCATRGFLRTVFGFFGCIVALALAGTLSGVVAELLYNHIAKDLLQYAIESRIDAALADGAVSGGSIVELLPSGLARIMQDSGQDILDIFWDGEVSLMVESLIDTALREPVLSILRGISFLLLFSLSLFLVRRLSRLFGGFNHLPLVGAVNVFLGGVVGVFQGALSLYLLAVFVQVVILASGGEWPLVNYDVIDLSFVFRVFFRAVAS